VACDCNWDITSITCLLIAHKADVNASNNLSSLPLILAIRRGHERILQCLFDANASLPTTAFERDHVLYAAAETGGVDIVELILSHYPSTATSIDAEVIEAAYEGSRGSDVYPVLDCFLDGAGSVYKLDNKSALVSPIWSACHHCEAKLLQYLLRFGPDLSSEPGEIPVIYEPVLRRFTEGVRMLIEHGADANARVPLEQTETLLSCAARNNDIATAKVLLDAKADPNVVVEEMPLAIAMLSNQSEMVELLLQHGADPSLFDTSSVTVKSVV